jgi:Ca2+-binding EF-hand superfamily protein
MQEVLYGVSQEPLMMRVWGIFALLLAALVLLGSAQAADDGKKSKDIDAIFRKLDANMDGKLTRDEFLKIADRFRDKERARIELGRTFDKLDPNNQGLTKVQFRTFVETTTKKKVEK